MPKPKKGARFGGSASHQKAIFANLATALFEHGRITTTESKAKALRPYAEKLVTHAKAGTLAQRREVLKVIRNKDVVHTLFAEIGPSFEDRNGGYTRIIKTMPRKGDNAPMAVIELVREKTRHQRGRSRSPRQPRRRKLRPPRTTWSRPSRPTPPMPRSRTRMPSSSRSRTTTASAADADEAKKD